MMRNQGLDGLQSYIDEETKKDSFKPPTPPPTVEQLNKDIESASDKVAKAKKKLDDEKANNELIASVVEKLEAKGNLSQADLVKAQQEIQKNYIGSISIGELHKDLDLTDFTSQIADSDESLKSKKSDLSEARKKLEGLVSDLENYDAVQKEYAQKLGDYLAISHAQKSIVEDPEFGLKEYPTDGDEHDKEKHQENVRRVQGRRFKKMTEEQRNTMVGRIKEEIDEVVAS